MGGEDLGEGFDRKGRRPCEKEDAQGAELVALQQVRSGLGAEAAARVCSVQRGGGEPGT